MWVKEANGSTRPLTEEDMNAIANYMDDDLRERLHLELAPCSPAAFIAAYVAEDPSFVITLNEFNVHNGYWYAVVKEDDSDWGTGSFDYEEARQMVRELSDSEDDRHYIAFIDIGEDGEADSLCVKEVHFDDKELGFIPVLVNGERKMMTYEAVCRELQMNPADHFVNVTKAGKIGFTCGKPDEVQTLLCRVKEKRFSPTDGLFLSAMGRKMQKTDRLEYLPKAVAPSRHKHDIAL